MVDEMNAGRRGFIAKDESRVRGIGRRPDRSAIESHCEQDGGEEGQGDDGAPDGGPRSMRHSQSIAPYISGAIQS
jgi:hypothetical protein